MTFTDGSTKELSTAPAPACPLPLNMRAQWDASKERDAGSGDRKKREQAETEGGKKMYVSALPESAFCRIFFGNCLV